jgi:beta-lactamase regulating signal transducer with metallopeptidase domain
MNWTPHLHWIASTALERLLYCAIQGSLLAIVVSLGLRFIPRKSSRTVFVIWFTALVASTVLPLVATDFHWSGAAEPSSALFTLSISTALYVFVGWVALAVAGLTRVAAGIRQVRRLKFNGAPVQVNSLGPEIVGLVEAFQSTRQVAILVSDRVQVPTALGFFKPAIVLPKWMAEEGATEELRHVLLHELTHLKRRDDWTNLVQKVVKALLFFNPGVWWMERELSLHREIACDDAVLAQTSSPRTYAECLARVAEKSFLRRQIAMAQAAVSRVRQLTVRVARILDPNRAATTQIWRPAIPAVAAVALVSGISVAHAPELVRVDDGAKAVATSYVSRETAQPDFAIPASAPSPKVRAWSAGLTTAGKPSVAVAKQSVANWKPKSSAVPKATQVRAKHDRRSPAIMAAYTEPRPAVQSAASVEQGEFVLVVQTRQTITAANDGWQVSVQEVRWLIPLRQIQKPVSGKI